MRSEPTGPLDHSVGLGWRAAGVSWWLYAIFTLLPALSGIPELLLPALIRAALAAVLGAILWRGGGRGWAILATFLSIWVFPSIFLAATDVPRLYLVTAAPVLAAGLACFATSAWCLWSTFRQANSGDG